jgi:hypothetical protein
MGGVVDSDGFCPLMNCSLSLLIFSIICAIIEVKITAIGGVVWERKNIRIRVIGFDAV